MSTDPVETEKSAEYEQIFKRFDANNDGKISLSELSKALKALGSFSDDEVQAMLSDIDSNKDGDIDFMEFLKFAEKNDGLATGLG
ncbi:EF-hand domain-containing protein [Pseudomonas sp. LP_7_YM]|uniref:EF-hand domain-containing protein n=1 Tax=Pseudomonas sp. LP_7_YM TaxID=2485137 RepID=UPI00105EA498|nr:EF-hand domain-containing protein [Pseudomonas sp. LP_7_YM]TDV58824.1 calcium-binding protein CML [Pseudomonas sp. LP_7_YM]